jgi:hypothetical protein
MIFLCSVAAEETKDGTIKVKRLKISSSLQLIQAQNLVKQDVAALQDVDTVFWVQAKGKETSTGKYAVSWLPHNKKAKSSGTPFYITINSKYALNQYCTSWSVYPYLYSVYDFWDPSANTEYWNYIGVNTDDLNDYFNINLSTYENNLNGHLSDCLFDVSVSYIPELLDRHVGVVSIPSLSLYPDNEWTTLAPRIGFSYDIAEGKIESRPAPKIKKKNLYSELAFSWVDMVEPLPNGANGPPSIPFFTISNANKEGTWYCYVEVWSEKKNTNKYRSRKIAESKEMFRAFTDLNITRPTNWEMRASLTYLDWEFNDQFKKGETNPYNINIFHHELEQDGIPVRQRLPTYWMLNLGLEKQYELNKNDRVYVNECLEPIRFESPIPDPVSPYFLRLSSWTRIKGEMDHQAFSDEPQKALDFVRLSDYLENKEDVGEPILPKIMTVSSTTEAMQTVLAAEVLKLNTETNTIEVKAKIQAKGGEGDFLWNPQVIVCGNRVYFYYQVYKYNGKQEGYLAWMRTKDLLK